MSSSEYFNSNPSKRTSVLKLRPSALNPPAHVMMPSHLNIPWSPCEMSWASQSNTTGVVEFRGQTNNALHFKRKAEPEQSYTKPKKLITEEKMAEHLDGLHISPDFTSHSTPNLDDTVSMEADPSSSSTDCQYAKTQDLEQKLRNAQRITICEQIRKLQNDPVLPQAILSRFERPCTALVLWQPPPSITELCATLQEKRARKLNAEEQDNNNSSSSIDFNNFMDLDM
ncbi:hypothetical protein Bhyg_17081 [Pseudolycoriella hygida]|uniref:Uncharacterized protein n=1 Tax=Pseudolycoriella hygida TaxID=35572 RepID=A0A9Q0MIK3_9DIPT|nr:hypothetical protein Bhyg_17081 [Pseudolycoriella hygida]